MNRLTVGEAVTVVIALLWLCTVWALPTGASGHTDKVTATASKAACDTDRACCPLAPSACCR